MTVEEAREQWLRYIKKIHVVWEENGEGRSRIYEVNSCYPDMAIPDGVFVFHVKKPE